MNDYFETPILFIIFNRPDTTQQVYNQIRSIKPKYLYVAADGHRKNKEGEFEKCAETRRIIEQVDWDCEVKTLFRDVNLGCGVAVSTAISWFFDQVEFGIILEDDCMPGLSFFPYCEELLVKYKDDDQIMLISGCNFQNGIQRGEGSYYFSYYPHVWGWASWNRAWSQYDFEMKNIEDFFEYGLHTVFESNPERKIFKNVLIKTKSKEINTWDYQWFYSIWRVNGFVITPNCNLVVNLGFRNSSTHQFLRDSYREIEEFSEMKLPLVHPGKKIDILADKTTFNNILSHDLRRLFRLFRENSLIFIVKYVIKRSSLTSSRKTVSFKSKEIGQFS